tara:strand:- start:2248 stop:2403 length:156 start_codon:yes stop_codon:yes gene_type:complete
MIKNTNTNTEYETLGQVNFLNENEELITAYTILIDGETITVDLPSEEWELI